METQLPCFLRQIVRRPPVLAEAEGSPLPAAQPRAAAYLPAVKLAAFRPVFPNAALISSPDTFFQVVREGYLDYRHRGMFIEHPRDCLLVYRLRENEQVFLGLIATLPTTEYERGAIKKHEGTLAASEQQQLQLLLLREASVKPVLLTHPHQPLIHALLEEAVATCRRVMNLPDGPTIEHTLFEVEAGSDLAERLRQAYAKTVPATYIADGHHRCSTMALYNRQLAERAETPVPLFAALFAADQVAINPYHRVAQLPVDLSPLSLMAKLSNICRIEALREPTAPTRLGEMTMLLRDESFRLTWLPAAVEGLENIDAGRFNELIADQVFGVTDIRTDERISYVPGTLGLRGMLDRVQHRPDRVGFMLFGLTPERMFEVVDEGGILPPKSTWFEPRMRNGLVVLEF